MSLFYKMLNESFFSDYENMSEQDQIQEVRADPAHIMYMKNPSEKVQLAAVSTEGRILQTLMKMFRSGDLETEPSDLVKKTAIENDGCAIVCLFGRAQTEELQLLAIRQNPVAIMYIWKPLDITYEKLKEWYPDKFNILYKNSQEKIAERQEKAAKKKALTENPYYQKVISDGMELQNVPDEEKTYDICSAAVKQNGMALQFVPEDMRDTGICYGAVYNDSDALQFVPKTIENYEDVAGLIRFK